MLTEWGSHTADLCQWANDADATSPIEYELVTEDALPPPYPAPADTPSSDPGATVVARYANGVKLFFEQGAWPLHVCFQGTEGWVYADDDGNVMAEPKSLLADHKFGKGYPQANHVRNFLDCVKTRRRPIAPAEGAHRANSACQIANICLQLGRNLTWNPDQERFVNDPMADRKLARANREPWRL
jgi:hypothetical protein